MLADCVRTGLVGWLITCPAAGLTARRLQRQATTATGFSFPRFASLAAAFGPGYRPRSPGSGSAFPLSVTEAAALANDIELELAGDDQVRAAALIAAHSPYAQPEVGSREWRSYAALLERLGIDTMAGDPGWRAAVRDRLRAFRRRVAQAQAAE